MGWQSVVSVRNRRAARKLQQKGSCHREMGFGLRLNWWTMETFCGGTSCGTDRRLRYRRTNLQEQPGELIGNVNPGCLHGRLCASSPAASRSYQMCDGRSAQMAVPFSWSRQGTWQNQSGQDHLPTRNGLQNACPQGLVPSSLFAQAAPLGGLAAADSLGRLRRLCVSFLTTPHMTTFPGSHLLQRDLTVHRNISPVGKS